MVRAITVAMLAAIVAAIASFADARADPAGDGGPFIRPGHEREVMALLGPFAAGVGGYRLTGAQIEKNGVVYSFAKPPDSAFDVVLRHPGAAHTGAQSRHFAIAVEGRGGDAGSGGIADVVVRQIQRNDAADIWTDPTARAAAGPMLLLLLGAAAAVLVGLWGRARAWVLGALDQIHVAADRLYFPLSVALLFTAAFLRFHHADLPVFEGGAIERLFISAQSPLKNLVSSYDPRHPGLYFAVLHWPVVLSGYSVFTARFVGLVFSVLSVLVAGALVRGRAGGLGALVAMALMAISPEIIFRGREITDLGLFMLLALAALLFYDRACARGRASDRAAFGVCAGLSLLSSYAALVTFAAIAVHALSERERRRALWRAVVAAALIGLPALVRIAASIPSEIASKRIAAEYTGYIWGGGGVRELAQTAVRDLFTAQLWIPVLVAAAAAMAVRRDGVRARGAVALTVLFNALFVGGAALFRMKPYYAIFLPVAVFVVVASLIETQGRQVFASFGEYARRVTPLAAALVICAALASDLRGRWEPVYVQSSNFDECACRPVTVAKLDGAETIVTDLSHDKIEVIYHFFERPFETMGRYYEPERASRPCGPNKDFAFFCEDAGSKRTVYSLTEVADPGPEWKHAAVEKLKRLLGSRPAHVLYNRRYPDEPLLEFLKARCEERFAGAKHLLYRCPRGNAPSAPPLQ